MSKILSTDISQPQKERLSHIDFRLNFLGSISRKDLINRFGIKGAAATRDISLYKDYAAKNLSYDEIIKVYKRTKDFVPLFEYSPSQVLAALSKGFGEDIAGTHKPLITCETPTKLNSPPLNILSALSRSIHQKKVAKITYRSVDNGQSVREIVPFALVDNGLRWHVRAYDRKRERFSDFVITRFLDATLSDSPIQDHETRESDIQWNRIVEMEITAHPKLEYPETIEHDYGMVNGVLKVNVRAAVAGYVLRTWNVDCSENHTLEGKEIHLWLRNVAALYAVENLSIAPGYKTNS